MNFRHILITKLKTIENQKGFEKTDSNDFKFEEKESYTTKYQISKAAVSHLYQHMTDYETDDILGNES